MYVHLKSMKGTSEHVYLTDIYFPLETSHMVLAIFTLNFLAYFYFAPTMSTCDNLSILYVL